MTASGKDPGTPPLKARRRPQTKLVRKSAEAVHITNNVTLVQRKLMNALLSAAYHQLDDDNITIHSISVRDLMALIGYESRNFDHLKKLLKNLTTTAIEWDILNEEGKREWGVSALLASADIVDGVCTYAYSPHLRKKLHNPKIFVLLNIDIVRRFHTVYALALYENCTRYRRIGNSPWFPLVILRSLLGAKEPYYDDFKKLNQKVLQPAIREINTMTDLRLEAELLKSERKVVEIRFKIESNPQASFQIEPKTEPASKPPGGRTSQKIEDVDAQPLPSIETGLPEPQNGLGVDISTLERLQEVFCLSSQVAQRVLKDFSIDAIQDAMAYVESKYATGRIKEIGPYFLTALREGASIRKSALELKREREQAAKQAEIERVESQKVERERNEQSRKEAIIVRFKESPEEQQASLLEQFEKMLASTKYKANILQLYQRRGRDSLAHPWVKSEFVEFLSNNEHG